MYSAKLTVPRRKRRRHDEVRQQTFPVPISSLTGIDASNDTWRWYEATLDQNSVKVSDDDAIKMLSTMGFFGQVRNSGASEEKFVSVDKFDPILNVSSDENVESGSVETADDKTEMSSGESDVEVEETKAKGWGKWKASEQEKEVLILDSLDAFFVTVTPPITIFALKIGSSAAAPSSATISFSTKTALRFITRPTRSEFRKTGPA
jgi:hypothetical protein